MRWLRVWELTPCGEKSTLVKICDFVEFTFGQYQRSVTAWRHSDVCGFQVSPLNLISNVFNVNTNRFDGSHKNLIDFTSAWRRREVLANHGTVNALVYFSSGANQRFERHRKWRVRLSQLWRAALAGVRFQRSRNSIDLRAPLSRNGALYHHAAAVWIHGLNRNPDQCRQYSRYFI